MTDLRNPFVLGKPIKDPIELKRLPPGGGL